MASIVFRGLDIRVAAHLAGLLVPDGHQIRRENHNVPLTGMLNADLVFLGGERRQYMPVLRRLRSANRALPVVVVSRAPAISEWLGVLEAGATDYCVPPFCLQHLRLLIAPNLPQLALAASAGRRG